MSGKAADGLRDLLKRTGGQKVTTRVLVNQAYAEFQHESLDLKHPRGGQAKYLELPMRDHEPEMLQHFAEGLLHAPDAALEWDHRVGVATGQLVHDHAPILFGDLRDSAGVTTKVGGTNVAVHPPKQHRLTKAELDAKDNLRLHHETGD